jgi:hypothetical protein
MMNPKKDNFAAVGFEPTPPKRPVPQTGALDRSATLPTKTNGNFLELFRWAPGSVSWHLYAILKLSCFWLNTTPDMILDTPARYNFDLYSSIESACSFYSERFNWEMPYLTQDQ